MSEQAAPPGHGPDVMLRRARGLLAGASPVRAGVWLLHMALPLLALWLLVQNPEADLRWEHHGAHFWLVAGVAAINLLLALRITDEAARRNDARLFLVSMAFLTSAAFLGLHALATPQVVLDRPNAGFVIATPVGLAAAAVFAVASTIDFGADASRAVMRARWVMLGALAAAVGAWAAISLAGLPPLDEPVDVREAHGPLVVVAIVGGALYAIAAGRFFLLNRRRPAVVLLSLITAYLLLAEALIAVAWARNWQASWWEWHLLMAAAFGFVAYSAQVQYWHEGTSTALFSGLALEETVRRVRAEYEQALEGLVRAIERRGEQDDDVPGAPLAAAVAAQYGLSERQADVLEQAGEALASERRYVRRLNTMVEMAERFSVYTDEETLLRTTLENVQTNTRPHFARLALIQEGQLTYLGARERPPQPDERAAIDAALQELRMVEVRPHGAGVLLAVPLTVKGRAAGILEIQRNDARDNRDRDRAMMRQLGSQISAALENVRLYRQVDMLFRSYMSPGVANALLADPSQASLGGEVREITVLFADLRGFTTFSERTDPAGVVEMLNRYFSTAVPNILDQEGTITQFAGDAIMAIWNAPAHQPDHALRAARAALAMQRAIAGLQQAAEWPLFRVGLHSGPALVGNVGAHDMRQYTAIGDTVNTASRLQTNAEEGQVLVSAATLAHLDDRADVKPVGEMRVKGKDEPIEAFVLLGLR